MGMIASTQANCHLAKGKPPMKPLDFIPKYGPPEKQSPEMMKKLLMGLVGASEK